MGIDYQKLGLMVGLEIHRQLATSSKLFCDCPPELFQDEPEITFLRKLRPTQSELGQIDPAAYFEFQKGMQILYEAGRATSCLVEMDEEPPHPVNLEAVNVCLTVAVMMQAAIIKELHVMRKSVIDGSNTTGFQRTCVVALNGAVEVGDKTIGIIHVSLEEDAARKMREERGNVQRYRIDRLGIPLIEVATTPVIETPIEAKDVALALGNILRATGKVKRGLGTIRQDLNISISKGALTEIKGVQELELLPLVIEYEVQRQLALLKIAAALNELVTKEDLTNQYFDVTTVFAQTNCKVIRQALLEKQSVLAVKLPSFHGFLRRELLPNHRLGTEMAERARFWGRVGGIFHTDELPGYGITVKELETLRRKVRAGPHDAVVFVADEPENARDALQAVVERAKEAVKGVPEETRAANPDGTTRYMRPRPGAARMYPETDVPPLLIPEAWIQSARAHLPKLPEEQLDRLLHEWKLNQKLAKQVLASEHMQLFEVLVTENQVSPTTVAIFLTETLKSLKRDGININKVSESHIRDLFSHLSAGKLTKEVLPDVTIWLASHANETVQDALNALGLEMLSMKDLQTIIDNILATHHSLLDTHKEKALGIFMGLVMRKVRGKANPALVRELLQKVMKQ